MKRKVPEILPFGKPGNQESRGGILPGAKEDLDGILSVPQCPSKAFYCAYPGHLAFSHYGLIFS